jgi:mRNA interferase HigB
LLPPWEQSILSLVRVIARRTLRKFWEQRGHGDAQQPLRAWFAEARHATWRSPADIKASYRNASFLANNRVVFNIAGNKFRLVVALKYSPQLVFMRFVGTHAQCDEIDASEV